MQLDYDDLFEVLSQEKDVVGIINPFVSAYQRKANEQLEGQLGSLKIAISKIISREIYWICSGDDFSLDINNPKAPKRDIKGFVIDEETTDHILSLNRNNN